MISEKLFTESKATIELNIKEFSELFSKEVQMLDNFCLSVTKKVDVLMGATTRLVEDLTTFNKDYSGDLK